jgi:hypothetical protein
MKKMICLFLAILMTLSLCACGGSNAGTQEEKPQLEIGYGKVNITPNYSVGLAASGDEKQRRSTGMVSYLFATCVAVKYGEETYLLYTVDTIGISETMGDMLRVEVLSEFPDLKLENIYFGATHTHSAPATGWSDDSPEGKYRQEFIAYMPQAAKLALKDLAPATLEACKFDLEGMNFVRHYLMNDGTYAGSNFGSTASGYKEHTYDVNHEMILVNFKREGKDDVMLVNWAAHPANPYDAAIGNLNISADHPGWCRDKLEQLTGAKVAYFNGASGDVVMRSAVESLKHGLNAKQYGEKLAEMAFEHINEMKPLEVDAVKTTQYKATVNVEHELEHLIPQCLEIKAVRSDRAQKDKADKMARDIGLSSAYHANAIISRSRMGATEQRTLNVFRIGPVSFTTGTYEMASEHAGELKAASPYEFTFQICGNTKYIPREEAIDYQSYEGTTRPYTRETGDVLVAKYVEMLESIK